MAVSDALRIAALTGADLHGAMALSTEAGWNQTADDWRHFIEQGRTIGVHDHDGRLVASAAALPYDGPFGFVGMVLVTESWRRRGIATRLVDQCIETLREQNLVPVLDATAAGEEVYRKQGFAAQFRFDRWQGDATGGVPEETAPADLKMMVRLDAEAFGAARPKLMADFVRRAGTRVFQADHGNGFGMVRHGRRAWQAGPIVASDEAAALGLVRQILRALEGRIFIDVPQRWSALASWLQSQGFTVQRSFARMALGRAETFGDPSRLFAVAGPEFG